MIEKQSNNINKIIDDFLTEVGENFPSKTAARVIFDKYPDLATFNRIYNRIRYVRGAHGAIKRQQVINNDPTHIREHRTVIRSITEFNLSEHKVGYEDYIIKHKKPLILSDIHIPHHDIRAIELSIEYGVSQGIDSVYLNGDMLDCARISRWNIDHKMLSFDQEREMFWSFIDYLKQLNVPIIFKTGNHEDRIEAYIKSKAPEVSMLKEYSIKHILKLDELGIDYVASRQKAKFGKLLVIHGHEFGESTFSPVNPARGLFLRSKASVLAGHNHQTSEHHENTLNNHSMACYSTGALCNLTPDYRPFAFTKWNLGFAIVDIYEDGSFRVDNRRIVKNKIR